MSRPDLSRLRFAPAATAAPTGPVPAPPDEVMQFSGADMLNAEMTAFARAVRDGTPYPTPIGEVLHGMAAFDAIVQSAESGAVVTIKNDGGGAFADV
jgi:predicted dehydrogenase